MKPKISVIIPCYNVEKYIEKCLQSVFNQTLKDIEIIAIDDGSKDETPKILDKLKTSHKNLTVIHKKNEGVSIARNVGLKEAKGEYIGFVDSDDFIAKDMYEKLYIKAKSADFDVVACDVKIIYPKIEKIISSGISTDNAPIKELLLNGYAVIWNKIYKRECLKNITFKNELSSFEDVLFLYMLYPKIKSIGVVQEALYSYYQREGSLTYSYSKKLYQVIDVLDEIINIYKDMNILAEYYEEIEYTYIRYLYATFIKRLAKTKDRAIYYDGYKYVKLKVKGQFPNYRSNKYLKNKSFKNVYLKYFNRLFAVFIFHIEKNKMN